jgi:predicted  nucleic acid-binding Zn-ribbon protein
VMPEDIDVRLARIEEKVNMICNWISESKGHGDRIYKAEIEIKQLKIEVDRLNKEGEAKDQKISELESIIKESRATIKTLKTLAGGIATIVIPLLIDALRKWVM